MKVFDSTKWKLWEGNSEGSGRSEKKWICNIETSEIGLFKFPKSSETKEHVSEKLAQEIADLLMLDCSRVEIGEYEGRIGSFSYRINKDSENLVEGLNLITKHFQDYDRDHLYDKKKGKFYCIEMIRESLSKKIFDDFLKIMVFDYLIGNTDRHHSNWAIIKEEEKERLSSLYDNGSSLTCYIREEDLDSYLDDKQNRFRALVDTKSKSRIRIDGSTKKEPRHKEVMEYLAKEYRKEIITFVDKVVMVVTEEEMHKLLSGIKDDLLSIKRKELIVRFLIAKRGILEDIFY